MPRTAKGHVPETENLFAQAINDKMAELSLTLLELSDKTGASYEHVRKLSRGLASPSPLMLKEICEVLKLNRKDMERIVTADKIRAQFGKIPDEIAGKNPEMTKLEQYWPNLTPEQKAGLEAQARTLIQLNRAAQK